MKLHPYQEELINSNSKVVFCNWCRGAGKTTGVAEYIIRKKPETVLLVQAMHFEKFLLFEILKQKALSLEIYRETAIEERVILTHSCGLKTLIKLTKGLMPIIRDEHFDLVVTEFPSGQPKRVDKDIVFCDKLIITFTLNTYHLHKEICEPDEHFINVDYRKMIKANPSSADLVIESALNSHRFFDEFALLDKPTNYEFNPQKIVQNLKKEFLCLSETNDTLEARSHIVSMIKNLQDIT